MRHLQPKHGAKVKPVICPLCGGNCKEPTNDTVQNAIKKAGGVASATELEGGGCQVVFGNGKTIKLRQWCNACDAEDLLDLLGRD